MRSVEELSTYYIAFLRALAIIHQNHHFVVRGNSFFSQHQMFDKLFSRANEDVDMMSEKLVGIFGSDFLDLQAQGQIIRHILERHSNGDPIEISLNAEKEFLKVSENFYEALKTEDKLTMGLDDAIMGIFNTHENSIYYLKQTNNGQDTLVSPVVARTNMFRKIVQARQKKNQE